MKKLFYSVTILLALLFLICCRSQKKFTWIYDFENDLTIEQTKSFDSLFESHEKVTSNEIVLVTIKDYGNDSDIQSYAVRFAREHAVGKKERNNGVVIVFSQAKHMVRIATGIGTEKYLTNDVAKKIVDSIMLPNFKQAEFFKGLWDGSNAIIEFLERPENKIN